MNSIPLNPDGINVLLQWGLSPQKLINCHIRKYEEGEYIFRQGFSMDFLFLIICGNAKVCVNAKNGKNLILYNYVSDGILGDIELMLDESIATTTVIAASEFSCVAIPLPANLNTLKNNLQLINYIGRELSQKLLNRDNAHIASALFTGEERLCSHILAMEQKGIFREYLTDTAQSIGISYRHVFRIINHLCQTGILKKTEIGFQILDMEALKKKSCSNEYTFD